MRAESAREAAKQVVGKTTEAWSLRIESYGGPPDVRKALQPDTFKVTFRRETRLGGGMFDWFKPEQRVLRRKVRIDRKCLEAGARRFLRSYLSADQGRKPQFYQAVEEATRECSPATWSLLVIEDAQIAEATSEAAFQIVLQRQKHAGPTKDGPTTFVTDAYATVAIAYRRAAGMYIRNKKMQELGTAAVHLLTMATSYTTGQRDESDSVTQ